MRDFWGFTRTQPARCRGVGSLGRRLRLAPRIQARHDAVHIRCGPVLAQLGLGLDPGNHQFHAHDCPQLPGNETLRCVVHVPGVVEAGLVHAGQPPDLPVQPNRIIMDHQPPVHMRRGVVPGGDNAPVLGLGRIPGRGNVGIRTLDDGQSLPGGGLGPLRVVPRQVPLQRAVLAGVGIVDERQERGHKPLRGRGHQVRCARPGEQVPDCFGDRGEVGWNVHGASPLMSEAVRDRVRKTVPGRA